METKIATTTMTLREIANLAGGLKARTQRLLDCIEVEGEALTELIKRTSERTSERTNTLFPLEWRWEIAVPDCLIAVLKEQRLIQQL